MEKTGNDTPQKKRSWWQKTKDIFRAGAHTPHERALGAALGVSMGLLPVFPLQLVLLGVLCVVIRCYRALAFVTVWILNPITFVPIYAGEFYLGAWLLKTPLGETTNLLSGSRQDLIALCRQSPELLLSLLAGGVIVSIAGGVITYIIVRLILAGTKKIKKRIISYFNNPA